MLPADVENYVKELARVLRPGGRALNTFFLLDNLNGRSPGSDRADHPLLREGGRLLGREQPYPEVAVAFEEGDVRDLYERHGFSGEQIHPGAWAGVDGPSFQDIVVATGARTAPARPDRQAAAAGAGVALDAAVRIGQGRPSHGWRGSAARALTLATLILLARALRPTTWGRCLPRSPWARLGSGLAMGGLRGRDDPDGRFAAARTRSSAAEISGSARPLQRRQPVILALIVVMAGSIPGAASAELVIAGLLLAITQGGTGIVASMFRARGQAARYAMATALLAAIGREAVAAAALALGAGRPSSCGRS